MLGRSRRSAYLHCELDKELDSSFETWSLTSYLYQKFENVYDLYVKLCRIATMYEFPTTLKDIDVYGGGKSYSVDGVTNGEILAARFLVSVHGWLKLLH